MNLGKFSHSTIGNGSGLVHISLQCHAGHIRCQPYLVISCCFLPKYHSDLQG